MKNLGAIEIAINNLTEKHHDFRFGIDSAFFEAYQSDIVQKGTLDVSVSLEKSATMIQIEFQIEGQVRLTCDRSLDEFDFPVHITKKIIYKYGDTKEELSDEIMVIPFNEEVLDIGPVVYDFVILEIPMKKLHPRFEGEDNSDDEPVKMVYSVETAPPDEESDAPDPRWDALRKMKN